MEYAFKETYSPYVPVELTYIVIIGDDSKLEVKASVESGLDFIELPTCGYLAAQRSSRYSWQAWIKSAGLHMDYGNRRNAVVSTVSIGPNEDKRRKWHVVGAHELGPTEICRIARMLLGFRRFAKPAATRQIGL